MKKLFGKVSFMIILTLAFSSAVFVMALLFAVDFMAPPRYGSTLAMLPSVSSEAWLIFDPETGFVIREYNADEQLPIASITKLATAKVFSDNNNLFATTTITYRDLWPEGRAGHLQVGDVYDFHTLLFPLLLESSNDAAYVMSRADDKTVDRLNDFVSNLSLANTAFDDTSGLSAKNVSSARDLSSLFTTIYKENRHIVDITGLPAYYSPDDGWLNNNTFIEDKDYVGGKQGYTPEAEHTAVAVFNESLMNEDERNIGYILLGSNNLDFDIGLLRDYVQNEVWYR